MNDVRPYAPAHVEREIDTGNVSETRKAIDAARDGRKTAIDLSASTSDMHGDSRDSAEGLRTHEAGSERERTISNAYEHAVTWRRNIFSVPFGASGKAFVDELAGLIQAFADGTTRRGICWKAVCVACHLLLQKPNEQASAPDHACQLQRRLLLWTNGKVEELLDEAFCIQNHLPERSKLRGNRAKTNGASDTIFFQAGIRGKD